MNKRFQTTLATVFILVLTVNQAFAAFPDTRGTLFDDAFTYLQQRNIVQGYPDGTAKPYGVLNRAEALKVIVSSEPSLNQRSLYHQQNAQPMALFHDISASDWFTPYIETAFEQGIVTGYPDGTFRPGKLLTVEEAVTLLMRSQGVQSGSAYQDSSLIENQPGQWYTPFITAAVRKNLVGTSQKLYLGTAITRGQFFEMVYRLDFITQQGFVSFPRSNQQPVAVYPSQNQYPGPTTISVGQPIGSTTSTVPTGSIPVDHPYGSQQYFSVSIPSAGITDLTITHPTDPFSNDGILAPLQHGVGHLFSYPGGGGKIMIYGHSSGYPWDVSQFTKIFRNINELNTGDKIYVTYDGTLYVYEVTFEEAVDAEDTSRFNDEGTGEELILYTCWPRDSIEQRYLVHAIPVETISLR